MSSHTRRAEQKSVVGIDQLVREGNSFDRAWHIANFVMNTITWLTLLYVLIK